MRKSNIAKKLAYAAYRSGNSGPKRIPVVIDNCLFSSIVDGAYYLGQTHPELYMHTTAAKNGDINRITDNLVGMIRYNCKVYQNGKFAKHEWFFAEEGEPDTWEEPIENLVDLRRKNLRIVR